MIRRNRLVENNVSSKVEFISFNFITYMAMLFCSIPQEDIFCVSRFKFIVIMRSQAWKHCNPKIPSCAKSYFLS